jgi:hypothetical protein
MMSGMSACTPALRCRPKREWILSWFNFQRCTGRCGLNHNRADVEKTKAKARQRRHSNGVAVEPRTQTNGGRKVDIEKRLPQLSRRRHVAEKVDHAGAKRQARQRPRKRSVKFRAVRGGRRNSTGRETVR